MYKGGEDSVQIKSKFAEIFSLLLVSDFIQPIFR